MPRKGNLSGFTDKEDPDWIANVLSATRARPQEKKRSRDRKSGMYIFFDEPFRKLLHQAAKKRGISITGYGRRAVAAFIAADLGLTLEEVVYHSAQPRDYDQAATVKKGLSHDDGTGYGTWDTGRPPLK